MKILLLACIAFWGSGAAQFLHEQLEHGGRRPASATASISKGDGCGHSQDQCPVCAMLATMRAASPAPPPVILSSQSFVGIVLVSQCQTPLAAFIQFPLSRGPPAISSMLSA